MSKLPEGYVTDVGFDPAEDHIGPFYYRIDRIDSAMGNNDYRCAFVASAKNTNVDGIVHGGVLMAFADFALCLAATDHYHEESCATVSFSSQFIVGAQLGDLIECTPKIVRKSGSLVFMSGELVVLDKVVMTFNAVVKRLRSKP